MRLLTFAVLLAAAPFVHAQTLLSSDFEGQGDQPEGWSFARARGECFGKWDSEHAASGERSIRLAIPDDVTARAHWRHAQRIPIEPETSYRLSMKALVVNVTGEAYAICYENGVETPSNWHVSRRLAGTSDWADVSFEFRTRPDAEWLLLILKLRHGTGYAWFDDVKLERIDAGPAAEPAIRVFPADDGFPIQAMWQPAQWTQHDTFHLMRGHINPLAVYFWGADKSAIDSPAIVVEAPVGITLRGPVVRGRGPTPQDEMVAPEDVTREGKPFRSWRFSIPQAPLLDAFRSKPSWSEYHFIYADVAPDCPAGGTVRWRLENAGTLGPSHELKLAVSDTVPGKLTPPDDFPIYVQHTGALRHPDPAVREGLVKYLNTAGIIGGFSLTYWEADKVDMDRQLADLGLQLHTWRFDGFDGIAPDDCRVIDSKGETVRDKVCPEAQLQHVQPWYDNLKTHYVEKLASGLKRLIIDYEPPVGGICFCARCRTAFAARFDLPADECGSLQADELLNKYRLQWGRFRAEQNGAIVKLHIALIHEVDPEVQVGLCSWHGTEAAANSGADIRLFEPDAAFHCPMIYTSGLSYHDAVAETCERTTAPVLPFIELADISQPRSLTPNELRMNLLATAFSGGGGAVMWVGMECFDAEYMGSIATAVREIARLRKIAPYSRSAPDWVKAAADAKQMGPITVDGRPIELLANNPLPYVRQHIWGDENRAVVTILNYDDEASYDVRVSLAKRRLGTYTITSTPHRNAVDRDLADDEFAKGITVTVPPGDLASLAVEFKH